MALVLCVPLSMPMKRLMGWYWDLMGVADRAKPGETNQRSAGLPRALRYKERPRERTRGLGESVWSASAFQRRAEARDAAHAFLDRLVGGGVAEAQAIVGAKRTAGNRGDLLLLEELQNSPEVRPNELMTEEVERALGETAADAGDLVELGVQEFATAVERLEHRGERGSGLSFP